MTYMNYQIQKLNYMCLKTIETKLQLNIAIKTKLPVVLKISFMFVLVFMSYIIEFLFVFFYIKDNMTSPVYVSSKALMIELL